MRPLADHAQGRDNNFNLLRMAAASMVIYAHAYPLVQGYRGRNPDWSGDVLYDLTGIDSGRIGVQIFFVMSGFLVAQSLSRRPSLVEFFWARALRIVPALLMAILAGALVFGLAFSELGVRDYLASPELRAFLARNLTLHVPPHNALSSVFAANPYPNVVNGSLWTIPWELKMYLSLGLLGLVGVYRHRLWVAVLYAAAFAAFCLALQGARAGGPGLSMLIAFFAYFYTGVMLWLFREKIRLDGATLAAGVALLIGVLLLFKGSVLARSVYPLVLGYAIIGLALLPSGPIRAFNRLGDYSYGTYLYAFPVQQSLMALFPDLTPIPLCFAALAATLAIAVPSWHFLEKPMLALKSRTPRLAARAAAPVAKEPAP